MDRLLQVVGENKTLCLDAENPVWEDARGYLFDPGSNTLYFPAAKRYLDGRSLDRYEVLIWSQPRVLVAGHLLPASSNEDTELEGRLAAAKGMVPDQIDRLLFDQRHHKPRKNRYKLLIDSVREVTTPSRAWSA